MVILIEAVLSTGSQRILWLIGGPTLLWVEGTVDPFGASSRRYLGITRLLLHGVSRMLLQVSLDFEDEMLWSDRLSTRLVC